MSAVVTADDRREDERIAVGLRALLTYRDGALICTEAEAGMADRSVRPLPEPGPADRAAVLVSARAL